MDMNTDIKFGDDIYEALDKNQIPNKIAHIIPTNFDDFEEDTTVIDEEENSEELSQ